ncbi:hypothetical protein PPYR_12930 [Photinus pyralis]|uniref:Uncharacterized protein n=1 Tax=Photinus pyralis TaxID=7054 RepID=A0A5N4A7L5_PHOPY|nr:hypothetical protein PPYR_12930 [Photinus pyralis]
MTGIYLLFFANILLVNAGINPKTRVYFKQCMEEDAVENNNACLLLNAQRVVALIPSDKPIEIKQWTIKGTKLLSYDQHYQNIKLYNHHQAKILKAGLEANEILETWKLVLEFHVPEVLFVSDYEFEPGSKLLNVDIASKGKVTYHHSKTFVIYLFI